MATSIAVHVTLRVARGAADQQREIDAWLGLRDDVRQGDATNDARHRSSNQRERAILAEGAFFELAAPPPVALTRLAAGCVCCVGWVPLRVHLQRAVRAGARRVLLLIASDGHLPRVRDMLLQPQPGMDLRLDESKPQ